MAERQLPERLGTIKDAAAIGLVSTKTIRRRMRAGQLTAYRLGRQILRFDLDEVQQLFIREDDAA